MPEINGRYRGVVSVERGLYRGGSLYNETLIGVVISFELTARKYQRVLFLKHNINSV